MTPEEIVAGLRAGRYLLGSEARLQNSIELQLLAIGARFEREKRLGPGNRIDFLAEGGVGIEAKTHFPRRKIFRQLERYAQHQDIRALVLVTATALGLPPLIGGKPVYFVALGRTAL